MRPSVASHLNWKGGMVSLGFCAFGRGELSRRGSQEGSCPIGFSGLSHGIAPRPLQPRWIPCRLFGRKHSLLPIQLLGDFAERNQELSLLLIYHFSSAPNHPQLHHAVPKPHRLQHPRIQSCRFSHLNMGQEGPLGQEVRIQFTMFSLVAIS